MFGQGFSLPPAGSFEGRKGIREGGWPSRSGSPPGVTRVSLRNSCGQGQPAGHKGWAGTLDNIRSVPGWW